MKRKLVPPVGRETIRVLLLLHELRPWRSRAIGTTKPDGSDTVDYGWSRNRYVRPEDIEATIYSARGIDWTTIRKDDPFHRGFEYVPFSEQDLYGPINELWG